MTPDQTTPPEALNPEMCASCAGIQQNWRRARGHAELVQGGHRTVEHKHGMVTITRYRCECCGTVWEYENNKCNRQAGWSVLVRKP
ncbi:hypothetical protein HUU62_11565 [Rhodoferax sp. 4810]|nr:hypothetical protein [Rhodoferax jenense]